MISPGNESITEEAARETCVELTARAFVRDPQLGETDLFKTEDGSFYVTDARPTSASRSRATSAESKRWRAQEGERSLVGSKIGDER